MRVVLLCCCVVVVVVAVVRIVVGVVAVVRRSGCGRNRHSLVVVVYAGRICVLSTHGCILTCFCCHRWLLVAVVAVVKVVKVSTAAAAVAI